MKILDWYILRKYLSSYVFVVVMLVAIICVIDYTEKNEDFISKKVPIEEIVFDYYLNFIPYIINLVSPIMVFIATVFVTAKLAGRTEFIAILNSGVSFLRILVPYIIGSSIIAVATFYSYGWVIPKASRIRHSFENKYIRAQFYFDKRNIHMKIAPYTYMYMESYNNALQCGYQFTLERIDSGRVLEKWTANRLQWKPELRKWRMEFYTKHTFSGLEENIERGQYFDTTLSISPEDFETQHMLYEQLTINELNAHIQKLRDRGAENIEPYLIEKYERFTYPFAIIILTVIGVIVSGRKTREGIGLQVAFGFFLAFVYIIFVVIGRSLANVGGIPPSISAWIPNAVFAAIGFIMYLRLPK